MKLCHCFRSGTDLCCFFPFKRPHGTACGRGTDQSGQSCYHSCSEAVHQGRGGEERNATCSRGGPAPCRFRGELSEGSDRLWRKVSGHLLYGSWKQPIFGRFLNCCFNHRRSDHAPGRDEEAAFLSSLKSLWRGFIHMHSVAKLVTRAFPVSGVLDNLTQVNTLQDLRA